MYINANPIGRIKATAGALACVVTGSDAKPAQTVTVVYSINNIAGSPVVVDPALGAPYFCEQRLGNDTLTVGVTRNFDGHLTVNVEANGQKAQSDF